MISLRNFDYRMDMDVLSRRKCLKKAIKAKGYEKVIKRLEFLLINQRYVYQTENDIKFCVRKMMSSLAIQ